MTDVAASDFRHSSRYVRLDTILRLRWLAALGQLTIHLITLCFGALAIGAVTLIAVNLLAPDDEAPQ